MDVLALLILTASPECYCTGSRGERVDLGRTACLALPGRTVEAVCDMSVNNPTWRVTGRPCVLG